MQPDILVVTRIAVRGLFDRAEGTIDHFSDDYLEARWRLLQSFALPCLQAQTDQQFGWVILVDPELPAKWRQRLEALSAVRERTHVVDFPADGTPERRKWTADLVLPGTDYLITSYLDDDDSFPIDYVEQMRRHLLATAEQDGVQPALVIAADETIQWDMQFSAEAPLGYRVEYFKHPLLTTTSVGCSLAAKFPEISLSVLDMKHRWAFNHLDFAEPPETGFVRRFRKQAIAQAGAAGLAFDEGARGHLDMSEWVGPVLMVNHTMNCQTERLYAPKPGRKPVTGVESFPRFAIDWEAVSRFSESYALKGG